MRPTKLSLIFALFLLAVIDLSHTVHAQLPPAEAAKPPIGAGDCSSLTGDCTAELKNLTVVPITLYSPGTCYYGGGATAAPIDASVYIPLQTYAACYGAGYHFYDTTGKYPVQTDSWRGSVAEDGKGPVSALLVPAPNRSVQLPMDIAKGFTVYVLYRFDQVGYNSDLIVSVSGDKSGPLLALVNDGSHFRLDTRLANTPASSPVAYSQYFWDPVVPTYLQKLGSYAPYTWYHIFLTVLPDGRVKLDVFNYNPNRKSPGLQFDWNESVLEQGASALYSGAVGNQSKTLLGAGENLAFSYYDAATNDGKPFPASWNHGYSNPYMNQSILYKQPLGLGAMFALYMQNMQLATGGNPGVPSHVSASITDSNVSGSPNGYGYSYPCDSGRFLQRPAAAESGPITINTPCSSLASPFTFVTPPSPQVALSTTSLAYQVQASPTPQTAPSQAVTLTNSGGASLIISSLNIGGDDPGDFNESDNCVTTLAAGASCSINVSFTSYDLSGGTATLNIVSNAPSSPASISLQGRAN